MDITIQDVHTYLNMVRAGTADPIVLSNSDSTLIIPALDKDEKVYFRDLSEGINIYPSLDTIKIIRKTIDSL